MEILIFPFLSTQDLWENFLGLLLNVWVELKAAFLGMIFNFAA